MAKWVLDKINDKVAKLTAERDAAEAKLKAAQAANDISAQIEAEEAAKAGDEVGGMSDQPKPKPIEWPHSFASEGAR